MFWPWMGVLTQWFGRGEKDKEEFSTHWSKRNIVFLGWKRKPGRKEKGDFWPKWVLLSGRPDPTVGACADPPSREHPVERLHGRPSDIARIVHAIFQSFAAFAIAFVSDKTPLGNPNDTYVLLCGCACRLHELGRGGRKKIRKHLNLRRSRLVKRHDTAFGSRPEFRTVVTIKRTPEEKSPNGCPVRIPNAARYEGRGGTRRRQWPIYGG